MTVAELLARISSAELTEWMAFAELEPFGGDVPFLGSAIVASTVANANRKQGTKAMPISEFMPKWRTKSQTTVEQIGIAKMFTAAYPKEEK